MKSGKQKLNFYTLKELEKVLGVQERTLFRYLESGALKGSKVGKWRFTDEDIKNFIKNGRTAEKSNRKKRK